MPQNKPRRNYKIVNTYNITEQHLWLARNLGCRFVPLSQKKFAEIERLLYIGRVNRGQKKTRSLNECGLSGVKIGVL